MRRRHNRITTPAQLPDPDDRSGSCEWQGERLEYTDRGDGSRVWHFGGPAGDQTYDEHGEPSS